LDIAEKGYRGVILDWMWVDRPTSVTGFPLTVPDQQDYFRWMSTVTRNLGMAFGTWATADEYETPKSAALVDMSITQNVLGNSLINPHQWLQAGG
jgi:hypothetical protein